MEEVLVIIDEIENFIFDLDIKSASNSIERLLGKLVNLSSKLDDKDLLNLNEILNYMNIALKNKDYLLYNDILEYELKNLIKTQY